MMRGISGYSCPGCQRRNCLVQLSYGNNVWTCLNCIKVWTAQELQSAAKPHLVLENTSEIPNIWAPIMEKYAIGSQHTDPYQSSSFEKYWKQVFGSPGVWNGQIYTHSSEPSALSPPSPVDDADPVLLGDDIPDPEGSPPVIEGSIIGYRAWALNFSTWQLTGTGYGRTHPWVPGDNESKCLVNHHHDMPAPDCHCGFNCLARFDNTHAWWKWAKGSGVGDIAGAVEAWSENPDHPDQLASLVIDPPGFRARYARIVLLAIDPSWPKPKQAAVRAVAAEYGADTCQIEHLEDAAKEHGQLLPDEWLEWAKTWSVPEQTLANTQLPATTLQGFAAEMRKQIKAAGMSVEEATKALNSWGRLPTPSTKSTVKPKKRKPSVKVKQTLKTVGPPTLGKWKTKDRVKDRKNQIWTCIASGSPGTWVKGAECVDPRKTQEAETTFTVYFGSKYPILTTDPGLSNT